MIPLPAGVQVWLATGHTDMRKGFDGLALLVQETLKRNPHMAFVRVPRPARRAAQSAVARWTGHVPVREAAGTRPFCLAIDHSSRGADRSVTITPAQLDIAGRNRLASAATHVAPAICRLNAIVNLVARMDYKRSDL